VSGDPSNFEPYSHAASRRSFMYAGCMPLQIKSRRSCAIRQPLHLQLFLAVVLSLTSESNVLVRLRMENVLEKSPTIPPPEPLYALLVVFGVICSTSPNVTVPSPFVTLIGDKIITGIRYLLLLIAPDQPTCTLFGQMKRSSNELPQHFAFGLSGKKTFHNG